MLKSLSVERPTGTDSGDSFGRWCVALGHVVQYFINFATLDICE